MLLGIFRGFFPVVMGEVVASKYCQQKGGQVNVKIEAFKILCLA